jgi:DNA-binding NtrC family response regulator
VETAQDPERIHLPGLLLVDSDPQTRAALAHGMGGYGWRVWAAADVESALDTYRRERDRIDVALVDLQLPGLQGGRLLEELGRLDHELTRCAMSADVPPYTASAFRRLCDTPLFIKPLDVPALALALYEMVAVRSARLAPGPAD